MIETNKNRRWRKFGPIILLLAFILFFWFDPTVKDQACTRYRDKVPDLVYSGEVLRVFVDSAEHMYRTVVLISDGGNRQTIYLDFDKSGLFEYLRERDRLVKNKGSYDVQVIRGEKNKVFTLDYGCPEIEE